MSQGEGHEGLCCFVFIACNSTYPGGPFRSLPSYFLLGVNKKHGC